MLLTELWEVFDYFAEEPPAHLLLYYLARWTGYKPVESPRSAEEKRNVTLKEAAKLNRTVDLRQLGPMKKILEMPKHVQEATRATLARMREKA